MSPQQKTASETRRAALQEFEQILRKASDKRASDLHLKAGLPPIVRVNGNLFYLGDSTTKEGNGLNRLTDEQLQRYAYALMGPRQKAKYEEGAEVDLGYEISGIGRFRINLCQQRSKPRLVCRHIPEMIRSLAELGLPISVEQLALQQRGLVLVTGSTGSGKSTTLASLIDLIARTRSCHILTIEDPIEFVFKDRKSIVTQREVGLDTKGFAHALKYALRQDPDVILVGEMRDEETILMALNAAETGHLVLSTLHTSDAPETVNRILGSVSEGLQAAVRAQLAAVLVGVVSQRLVKRADGKGRIPAAEVLLNNVRVREMISDPQRTIGLAQVIESSNNSGMQTFDQGLMLLYRKGLITKEEALLSCTNVRDFQLRLGGVVPGEWREEENHQQIDRAQQVKQLLEESEHSLHLETSEFNPKKRSNE